MDPTTNPSDPKPKPKAEPDDADASSSSGASNPRHPNAVTITVTKFPSKEKTTKPVPTYQTKAYRAVEAKLAEVKKAYDALDEKQSEDWEWLTYLQKQADDLSKRTSMKLEKLDLLTSSSSSSGSLKSTMDSNTKSSGPSKMKLDPEGDAKVSALTYVLSSADLADCLNKLAVNPRLEEEEKPAKRVPVYDRKAYGRLEDELAKVKLNYRTLSQEHSKDLKELNKLSELKRELSQELESLYKKSLV